MTHSYAATATTERAVMCQPPVPGARVTRIGKMARQIAAIYWEPCEGDSLRLVISCVYLR